MTPSLLDSTVQVARGELRDLGVPDPALVFLCGTGLPTFAASTAPGDTSGFRRHGAVELTTVRSLPAPWNTGSLVHGVIDSPAGPATAWLLEDASLEFAPGRERPAFEGGLPIWLAAAAGARVLVHTSAGGALPGAELDVGDLCIVDDALNLSGSTPLLGVGESQLGPLFPDLTRLFSAHLTDVAKQQASLLGIDAGPGVVAATAPVALATPAERRWFRQAGADVWAQGLHVPYLAAGHAGLEVLALVAVIDGLQGDEAKALQAATDVPRLVDRSESVAPALDDLLTHLAPEVAEHALSLGDTV